MFPGNENVPIHYLQNEPFYANQGMQSDGAYQLPNMLQDQFQLQGASLTNSMLFNTTNESLNRYLAGFVDQGGMDLFNDMHNSLKSHCEILQAQVQQMNQDEPRKMHESIEFHPTTSSTVRENQENKF